MTSIFLALALAFGWGVERPAAIAAGWGVEAPR